jgi:hypothetical protein
MRNARTNLIPTKAALLGGVVMAAAVVIAGVTLTVAPRHAQALPAYAAKEGKACGFCHVNPAGGGARNAAGKRYEANGHSFAKKK